MCISKTLSAAAQLLLQGGDIFKNLNLKEPQAVKQDLKNLSQILTKIFKLPPYSQRKDVFNERCLESIIHGMLILGDLQPISQLRVNHRDPDDEKDTFSKIDICSLKSNSKLLLIETKYTTIYLH